MNPIKFQITGTLTPVFLLNDQPVGKLEFCEAMRQCEHELFEVIAHEALRLADDPAAAAEEAEERR